MTIFKITKLIKYIKYIISFIKDFFLVKYLSIICNIRINNNDTVCILISINVFVHNHIYIKIVIVYLFLNRENILPTMEKYVFLYKFSLYVCIKKINKLPQNIRELYICNYVNT